MAGKRVLNTELLTKLLNSLPSPIFIKNSKHQFIYANDALCQLMGRSNEELIGKSGYDFSPKQEADIFWAMDNEVFESRKPNVNEENHTGRFGITRIIQTKK